MLWKAPLLRAALCLLPTCDACPGKPCVQSLLCLQIVSGSRDRTIKLWNTLGECKYTIGEPDGHTEWVSCVRFSPVTNNPIIVSAGWDKLVKVGCCCCCPGHVFLVCSADQFYVVLNFPAGCLHLCWGPHSASGPCWHIASGCLAVPVCFVHTCLTAVLPAPGLSLMYEPLQNTCKCEAAVPLPLQVWNLTNCKLRSSLVGHTGYINTVTVSPDGSLCASGGKVRCLCTLPESCWSLHAHFQSGGQWPQQTLHTCLLAVAASCSATQ